MTPLIWNREWKNRISPGAVHAFYTAIFLGLLTHLPVMVGDYPNHDGLASMYFSQNMITSGRWFLSLACGFSSFYSLPWISGLLSLLFLGLAAAFLVEVLGVRESPGASLIAALLAVFPSLASTYAYIFTADGYMMGLALAILAVFLTKRSKRGFIWGAVSLAFSMGIYQAYLPFAILLSMYSCIVILLSEKKAEEKRREVLRFPLMGVLGIALYYVILQVLLKIQGKVLDTYQGINGMASGEKPALTERILAIYRDFPAFTVKGGVLYNNMSSLVALLILIGLFLVLGIRFFSEKGLLKKWYFYAVTLLVVILIPPVCNVILLISPSVTYHSLMRYQWVLFPIIAFAFLIKYGFRRIETGGLSDKRGVVAIQWILLGAVLVLIGNYMVTDNIAYSNLEKKYERTYAYCIRMLDRMEQTPGYYPGIPIAMIGVQSKEQLPPVDHTEKVTAPLLGMSGDYLLYRDDNYKEFMKYYLGATINLVSEEEMERIYTTSEYQALDSFPGPESMKVVDGILYVKTE